MARSWATFGIDLHLERAPTKVRANLERELRDAVRDGRLAAGTRMPSSRSLAIDLGVARNTVADVYGQLVAEGWLATRHGAGTWIADRVVPRRSAGRGPGAVRSMRFDLRAGNPDLSSFPRANWLAAARKALAAAPDDVLGYRYPGGLPQLRAAVAAYVGRTRGVVTDPERIVVCSGFTQGLGLLCTVLRGRTTTIAVEGFGHRLHREVVVAHGFRLAPLEVDDGGADIAGLGDVGAALLTPAHQFPSGVPLAPYRRRAAVGWATSGRLLIEDDYDGEFRYDRQAVGAVQALDPERVVYAGTASKALAPGVRLGWLAAPAELVDELVDVKRSTGAFTSALDQLTLAEMIESGAYDRHVRRSRLAYRRRRERLVAELARVPGVRVRGVAAGMHLLVDLPPGTEAGDVVARAAERGLALQALADFAADGVHAPPALVIGYATPPAHAFTASVARLVAVLAG